MDMAYDASMKYLLLILVLIALPLNAEIYRWQDENGRIIYSDQYRPDAELVNVPNPVSYKPPVINNLPDEAETPKEPTQSYQLTILSPQQDQALWANDGNVPVSVDLRPELNIEKGEKLIVSLDGMPVGEPQESTSFTVEILERGLHTVSVSLINEMGATIVTSDPVTFQVHRASINRPSAP
jgi:hypothetical protein